MLKTWRFFFVLFVVLTALVILNTPLYTATGSDTAPVILYWRNYFSGSWQSRGWPMGDVTCGALKCRVTDDARQYLQSDAVLFHGRSLALKEIPDLSMRPANQVWMYVNFECPVYMGRNFDTTARNPSKIPNIINRTVSYIRDSDIHLPRYGSITPGVFEEGFDPKKNYLENKTRGAVAVISNCVPHRMKVINALAKHIDVDVYGSCGNKTLPCHGWRVHSKQCWTIRDYKFYLSFENHACTDYVTEKFYWSGLGLGLVPVVLGGANYSDERVAPPGSYIDATSFDSVKELGEFLTNEGSAPALYNKYFRWYSIHSQA